MAQHVEGARPAHASDPAQAAGGDDHELTILEPRFHAETFPWRQVAGYAASLLLTLIAFFGVVDHVLPVTALLFTILGLAALQAMVQLGFFMHLRESVGPTWHVLTLGLGIGVALGIVAFSAWIVAFKWGVS